MLFFDGKQEITENIFQILFFYPVFNVWICPRQNRYCFLEAYIHTQKNMVLGLGLGIHPKPIPNIII